MMYNIMAWTGGCSFLAFVVFLLVIHLRFMENEKQKIIERTPFIVYDSNGEAQRVTTFNHNGTIANVYIAHTVSWSDGAVRLTLPDETIYVIHKACKIEKLTNTEK